MCSQTIPFLRELQNPQATLDAMLRGKLVQLPGHIQAIYVQNILKIFAHILSEEEDKGDTDLLLNVRSQLTIEMKLDWLQCVRKD